MTIATDLSGENIAFGITTPMLTPYTPPKTAEHYCSTIAQRLTAQADTGHAAGTQSMTIPVPIQPVEDCTFYLLQAAALRAALNMTYFMNIYGWTVISCTPAAMAAPGDNAVVSVGFVLVATRHEDVQTLLDQQDSHAGPSLWTEFARSSYGQAAIDSAMESIKRKYKMSDKGDSNVH